MSASFLTKYIKCDKLENYEIKYRLTEKTEAGANFIVKIDKTKMLISASKNNMKLEVML